MGRSGTVTRWTRLACSRAQRTLPRDPYRRRTQIRTRGISVELGKTKTARLITIRVEQA